MNKEPITTDLETMFKTFVHNHKIRRLKNIWGWFLFILIMSALVFGIGATMINHCKLNYPNLTIKQCLYRNAQPAKPIPYK